MKNRIRIKSVEGDNRAAADLYTQRTPTFYRANQLVIELGLFTRERGLEDLTGLTGVRLKLMTAGEDGGPGGEGSLLYWDELVVTENFGEPTEATWKDGTAAHVTFTLPPEKTALAAGPWWVWCVSEGDVARTLFAGRFTCLEDGSGAGEVDEAEPLAVLRDAAIQAAEDAAATLVEIEAKRQEVEDNAAQVVLDKAAVSADKDAVAADRLAVEAAATQVATDAANAEAARLATEAGLADFSQRYLGPYAEAPAAPAEGWPLYYNTTTGKLQVWSGAAWASPVEGMAQAEADVRYALKAEAAKSFAPALYLPGTSGYVATPSALRQVFAGSNTLAMRVRLTGDLPAKDGVLFGTARATGTHRYMLKVYTSGQGRLFWGDVSAGNQLDLPGFATGWSRRSTWVVAVHDVTAHTLTLYRDGVAFGAPISISDLSGNDFLPMFLGAVQNDGTPGDFSTLYLEGATVFNRALTAAEVAARFGPQPTSPMVPVAERQAQLTPTLVTDFASGLDSWTLTVGGSVGTWTHDTDHGVLSVSTPGASANYPLITRSGVLLPGQLYRVSFDYSVTSGTCKFTGYYDGTNNTTPQETLSGSGTKTFTASRADGGALTLIFDGRNAFSLNIDNITATPVGAIAHYTAAQDARVGYQLSDLSANGNHSLLSATGCTWLEAGERGRLTLSGFTADAWLGGSERALIPAGYRIAEIIATETAGVAVSNLALGTTANGTDLVSSFSLLAGETKSLTVATSFTAKSAAKPVHINDAPGGPWGGASVSLTFILEKF